MAAFGSAAYANEVVALSDLVNKSVNAGYTLDADIGPNGAATAILASMLADAIPAPAGLVTAPGVATTGDSNTGMYFSAADKVDFAAGGVRVVRLNTATTGVNFLDLTAAAASSAPAIAAAGTDTNIDITLTPKGTGGVTFPDGAVGTPAITNAGDLNTGIYFSAADVVDVAAGGVRALRLNTATTGVNFLDVVPAAASSNPTLVAAGSDTNISLLLAGKGTGGVLVGGGTAITGMRVVSATLTPAAIAANTALEQTFTFTGLTTADTACFVQKPTAQGGLGIVNVRVQAADLLAVTFGNVTASAITPTAAEVYKVVAIRS